MSATPAPAAAEDRLDVRRVLPIFVVVLVDLLGLTVIIPLLPLYAATFRASPLTIGVLNALYPIAQLIGAPILGRLSDRYGRKPILLISQIGTLMGFVVLGFANTLLLLFVSRLIDGFSGGNIATAQAMIADSTTERTRTQGLGLIGAAFGLGFIVGPVIAFVALAASGNNFHVPAFVAAGFSLLSIGLTAFWLRETHDPAQRATTPGTTFAPTAVFRALAIPQLGLLFALVFFQQFAFGGFENVIPLFTVSRLGLNASGNAAVFVFVGIIVVVVQGRLAGQWSRRYGDRRLAVAGLALLAIGMALTALTPDQPVPWYRRAEVARQLQADPSQAQATRITLPADDHNGWLGIAWLLVAMVPMSIGGGLLPPSINSLITRRAPPSQRGEMLGNSAAFVSAANVVAPIVGYGMFQAIGLSAPLWLWTAILVLLLVAALRLIGTSRESPAAGAAT